MDLLLTATVNYGQYGQLPISAVDAERNRIYRLWDASPPRINERYICTIASSRAGGHSPAMARKPRREIQLFVDKLLKADPVEAGAEYLQGISRLGLGDFFLRALDKDKKLRRQIIALLDEAIDNWALVRIAQLRRDRPELLPPDPKHLKH